MLNDPKYKQLNEAKGRALEDRNWQIKEAVNAKKDSRNNSPVKGKKIECLFDDNEDSMEKELIKMDEEII